jgi:hypothetical protein
MELGGKADQAMKPCIDTRNPDVSCAHTDVSLSVLLQDSSCVDRIFLFLKASHEPVALAKKDKCGRPPFPNLAVHQEGCSAKRDSSASSSKKPQSNKKKFVTGRVLNNRRLDDCRASRSAPSFVNKRFSWNRTAALHVSQQLSQLNCHSAVISWR